MSDAGTYTLVAENRNGKDKIDLDLVVLDLMQDCECDMFKSANVSNLSKYKGWFICI